MLHNGTAASLIGSFSTTGKRKYKKNRKAKVQEKPVRQAVKNWHKHM